LYLINAITGVDSADSVDWGAGWIYHVTIENLSVISKCATNLNYYIHIVFILLPIWISCLNYVYFAISLCIFIWLTFKKKVCTHAVLFYFNSTT